MPAVSNPKRTPVFRLLTVAASGLCSFVLGLWGLKFGFGDGFAGMQAGTMVGIASALCALAAAGAALSFFAGVDESVDYVFNETHFDKLTGLLARPAMVGKVADAASATIKTGEPVFLIDIDIDRFKQINDAIGYSHGDELIRAFTKRLRACMPAKPSPKPNLRPQSPRTKLQRPEAATVSSRNTGVRFGLLTAGIAQSLLHDPKNQLDFPEDHTRIHKS